MIIFPTSLPRLLAKRLRRGRGNRPGKKRKKEQRNAAVRAFLPLFSFFCVFFFLSFFFQSIRATRRGAVSKYIHARCERGALCSHNRGDDYYKLCDCRSFSQVLICNDKNFICKLHYFIRSIISFLKSRLYTRRTSHALGKKYFSVCN